jgi:ribonuclease D
MAAERGVMHQRAGSLAKICQAVLGTTVDKASFRLSKWTSAPLSDGQIAYAALDSELSL